MDNYKPGDLSKLLQMSSPNAVPVSEKKKSKKKVDVTGQTKEAKKTVIQCDKKQQKQSSIEENGNEKKLSKKRKQNTTNAEGTQVQKSPKKRKQTTTENKQLTKVSADAATPPSKTKKQDVSVSNTGDTVTEGKKKRKRKKRAASRTGVKRKKMEEDEEMMEKVAGQTKVSGYNPPAGIVHESLMKKNGNEAEASDGEDDDDDDDDMIVDGEEEDAEEDQTASDGKKSDKKRLRKDRLFKKVDDRTVFVGNMSLKVDKKKVKKLFKKFGEIETVRFRCVPVGDLKLPKKAVAIKKQFHPERHNCVAYIQFSEAEDAKKALANNGVLFEGLHIKVDMAGRNKTHATRNTVFVGNLPFDIEEEALRGHFEDCGTVEGVRVIRDKKTCLGKGFGYVTFSDTTAVAFAVKLNDQKLNGRPLRVMHCTASADQTGQKKNKEKFGKAGQKSGGSASFQGDIGDKEKKRQKKKEKRKDKRNNDKNKIVFNLKGKDSDKKTKESENLSSALTKMIADSKPVKAQTGVDEKEGKVKAADSSENAPKAKKGTKLKHNERNAFKRLKKTAAKSSENNTLNTESAPVKEKTNVVNEGNSPAKTSEKKGKFGGKKPGFEGKNDNLNVKQGFQGQKNNFGEKKPGFHGFKKDFSKPSPGQQTPKFGKKNFTDRPAFGSKFGDKKPGFNDRNSFGGPKFGDKKPGFNDRNSFGGPKFGDKKPGGFNNKNSFGGPKFGDKKPGGFNNRNSFGGPKFGDKKPGGFNNRDSFGGPKFGDKKPGFNNRNSFGGPTFGDKKPGFNNRNSFGGKSFTPNKPSTPAPSGKHITFDD